jgi:hypothetical protein
MRSRRPALQIDSVLAAVGCPSKGPCAELPRPGRVRAIRRRPVFRAEPVSAGAESVSSGAESVSSGLSL